MPIIPLSLACPLGCGQLVDPFGDHALCCRKNELWERRHRIHHFIGSHMTFFPHLHPPLLAPPSREWRVFYFPEVEDSSSRRMEKEMESSQALDMDKENVTGRGEKARAEESPAQRLQQLQTRGKTSGKTCSAPAVGRGTAPVAVTTKSNPHVAKGSKVRALPTLRHTTQHSSGAKGESSMKSLGGNTPAPVIQTLSALVGKYASPHREHSSGRGSNHRGINPPSSPRQADRAKIGSKPKNVPEDYQKSGA